jgi:hypothetical protein
MLKLPFELLLTLRSGVASAEHAGAPVAGGGGL